MGSAVPLASGLVVALLLLSGCVMASEQEPTRPGGVDSCFLHEEQQGRVCFASLAPESGDDADGGYHLEASIATHPTDPHQILLTWTERRYDPNAPLFGTAQVWAAITFDGGRSWESTQMRDPSIQRPPASSSYSFDSTAAFTSAGIPIVLYGGESVTTLGTVSDHSRITLARYVEHAWTYHVVAADRNTGGYDGMHMAAAPDAPYVYAAAHTATARSLYVWRSDDGGITWQQGPTVAEPIQAAYVAGAATGDFDYWPRLAAGTDGFVALTARRLDPSALRLWVSHDAGKEFADPVAVPGGEYDNHAGNPILWTPDGLGITLVSSDGYAVARSRDNGTTWEPTGLDAALVDSLPVRWSATASRNGSVALVATFQGAHWRAEVNVATNGNIVRVSAWESNAHPTGIGGGDEYGGIAFAADGRLWWTWSRSDTSIGIARTVGNVHEPSVMNTS